MRIYSNFWFCCKRLRTSHSHFQFNFIYVHNRTRTRQMFLNVKKEMGARLFLGARKWSKYHIGNKKKLVMYFLQIDKHMSFKILEIRLSCWIKHINDMTPFWKYNLPDCLPLSWHHPAHNVCCVFSPGPSSSGSQMYFSKSSSEQRHSFFERIIYDIIIINIPEF